jgi:hypothetical protein
MLRRTTVSVLIAVVLSAFAVPAAIAGPKAAARKGGKKPMGTVSSFDGTTLSVARKNGSSLTVTTDEDTRVKLEHRGRHARKGNPSNGTLEDLVVGAFVLKMKVDDDVLEKIRLRLPATSADACPAQGPSEDEGEPGSADAVAARRDDEGDEDDPDDEDDDDEGSEADTGESDAATDAEDETSEDSGDDTGKVCSPEGSGASEGSKDTGEVEDDQEAEDEAAEESEEDEDPEEQDPVDELLEDVPLP